MESKDFSSGSGDVPIPLPRKPLRILVAEDGKSAAEILGLFFELEGHGVRIARDGLQAVDLAGSYLPDLVLTDIRMPQLDGLQAAVRIRSQPGNERVVIVAMSGMDGDEDKRKCAAAGIDEHIVKPVSPADLRSLLERFQPRFIRDAD